MKNILYILAIVTILSSCDNSEDMFKDANNTPTITIKGGSNTSYGKHQNDSIKYEDVYYSLDYKIEDEESLKIEVKVDSIYRFEIKEDKIVFGTDKVGSSKIYITAVDSWGKKDELIFQLTCFKNLKPIAVLEVTPLTSVREYKIDASRSYDQDAKHGGKIDLYRFYVNGKEIEKTFHSYMNFTFPKTGEYKIGVQVKDNNDEWSELVQKTIII